MPPPTRPQFTVSAATERLRLVSKDACRDAMRRVGAPQHNEAGRVLLDRDALLAIAFYRLGRDVHEIPGSCLASAAHAIAQSRADVVEPLQFSTVVLGERSMGWRLELVPSAEQVPAPQSVVPVSSLLAEARDLAGVQA